MVDAIDIFSAYRTAPHIDVEETMRRSVDMLVRALRDGLSPFVAWCPVPVLLPGERTSTLQSPARELYAGLAACDARPGIWDASLMVGYVWADERRATAAAIMTGDDMETLRAAAEALARDYWEAREAFAFGAWTGSIRECVDRALASARRPFVIADSGDNPTGGGVGDRPDVLRELLARGRGEHHPGRHRRPRHATERAYAAGLRAGRSARPSAPRSIRRAAHRVEIDGVVTHLVDAPSAADRQAVVEVGGLSIVLTARRRPFHRVVDFTALGLDPRRRATSWWSRAVTWSRRSWRWRAATPWPCPPAWSIRRSSACRRLRKGEPTFPFDRDVAWRPRARASARAPA